MLLAAFVWNGCGVILEDDLSKNKVTVIAPAHGLVTTSQTIEFRWDSLPYATRYHVQLVRDSFNALNNLVLDTFLTNRSLQMTLPIDWYEWRVIGLNNSSESSYDDLAFQIVADSSLRYQTLTTIYPLTNAIYTTDSVSFWWYSLAINALYQLQVATHPSFNSQSIVQDYTTSNDNATFINLLGIGTYYWRLRALRPNVDTTVFTTTLQFSINVTPTLSTPINNNTVILPTILSWSSAQTIAQDSLYLYYNNEPNPYQIIASTTRGYTFTSADTMSKGAGNYYWRVRSVGQRGAVSSFSELRKFIIN